MSEKALCHRHFPFLRAHRKAPRTESWMDSNGAFTPKTKFTSLLRKFANYKIWCTTKYDVPKYDGPQLTIPWIPWKKPVRINNVCFQKERLWSIQETSAFAHSSYQLLPLLRVTTEQESGRGWEFEITELEIVNFNDCTIIRKKTLKTRRTFREICQLECRMCDRRVALCLYSEWSHGFKTSVSAKPLFLRTHLTRQIWQNCYSLYGYFLA